MEFIEFGSEEVNKIKSKEDLIKMFKEKLEENKKEKKEEDIGEKN